ncbi:MAG: class I adenylate-forming enzyme family protein [Actinomycetota bacterium]|nr:class I adenylate-forming enzyme family protein [Actinomycetota bacterium]
MMLLEMAAGGFADRVAVGTRDSGLTFAELFERSGAIADRLRSVAAGHLVLADVSSEALPAMLFGASWAGIPFVPLNYRLADAELRTLAGRVSPALAVAEPGAAGRLDGIDGVETVDRSVLWTELATALSADHDWAFDGEDVAVLLFTSGTTGDPKAAVLRQRHLVSYILGSVEFGSAGEEEAALVSVPPYHVAGIAAILSNAFAGRRLLQLPTFEPNAWIDLVRSEGVTSAMVVPTMLARIVEHLDAEGPGSPGLPTLRALSYGGGRMPQPVVERALELLPDTRFVNAYGLTETSSTVALLGPDEHRAAVASDDPAVRRRLASAGRPMPGIEVSIRDEAGAEAPVGQAGDIWLRGEQVSGEYREQGSRLTDDGWFPTNDGGWLDDEGYLFVTGRIDDVIVKGGQNISPGEIEGVLLRHPAVADAAAIGLPDHEWGERIVVAVATHTGVEASAEELCALVRRELRSNRTPDHVEFVDDLPYGDTGKLLRRVLREQLAHLGDA